MIIDVRALFERQMTFPNPDARARLHSLVGLDGHIDLLRKILALLVYPTALLRWGEKYHPGAKLLIDAVLTRPPLVILAGDVGSGKTALAESIGDAVARDAMIEVTLLPLSLAARGQGRIGEMTQLISAAFDHTIKEASTMIAGEITEGAVILLVDEADALAQSRATAEMHHEDVSGVNAFIRGIDRLSSRRLPAAVIMCTNRYEALDPAVKRRAAEILTFERPNDEKRKLLLGPKLAELGFSDAEIDRVVAATGPRNGTYGFTYSDLAQRLIPAMVLDAYPEQAISPARALELAEAMVPTAPFNEAGGAL
ncbi:AAA family ATPase [Sphingomonas hankyongi]|uniref:AAA family ATPase n=1 Tax=Sphingomonas hankyongi TaxID=2908209 RepID=A0ABT0S078_9SPHN|nr:AAA family ATPase [Sphingomonas hankyongi]MCL6729255.1 AAA family ATPase [Sphingomonas hankyongi]